MCAISAGFIDGPAAFESKGGCGAGWPAYNAKKAVCQRAIPKAFSILVTVPTGNDFWFSERRQPSNRHGPAEYGQAAAEPQSFRGALDRFRGNVGASSS
jgi:hypothetical protein